MAFNENTFNDGVTLLHVRTKVINPLVTYMKNEVDPKIDKIDRVERSANFAEQGVTALIPQVEASYSSVHSNDADKSITFTNNHGDGRVLSLKPMFDSLPPPAPTGIKVDAFTEVLDIGFSGATSAQDATTKKVTITIDPAEPIYGKVDGTDRAPITTVNITGNKGASAVANGVLTIDLPAGGGGGIDPPPVQTPPNFLGFYDSLDDLKEKVKDPVINKSYAYVRYNKDGFVYEVPYWFATGGDWKVLTTKPALVYKADGTADSVLVQSIKPNPDISVTSDGQLDLSNLNSRYFHGLFDSSDDMIREVKDPTVGKSFAYAKAAGTNTMLGWQYVAGAAGAANLWKICVPFGALGLVSSNGTGTSTSQTLYGVRKNDMVEIDAQGLITIKDVTAGDTAINVEICDKDDVAIKSSVENIRLKNSKAFASYTPADKTLILEAPQRVIQYGTSFEAAHNSQEYLGNIFYDTNTQSWMGQDTPPGVEPTGTTWTRIAHRHMSSEVKSLTKRLSPKVAPVTPGVTGDTLLWEVSSWSYVDKDNEQLPTELKDKVGGYFFTMVKDIATDPTKPTNRMQVFYSDEVVPKTFSRIWNKDAGISESQWHPWVKTSHNREDLVKHEEDPAAHKNVLKYHKVITFNPIYSELKANNYELKRRDIKVLVDSYGLSQTSDDQYLVIPYSGDFTLNGIFSPDNFDLSSGVAAGNWVLIITKTKPNGDQSLVKSFRVSSTVPVTGGPKDYTPAKWYLDKTAFNKGDKLSFKLKHDNDASFASKYKDVNKPPRFHAFRSYIVIESDGTEAGSMIAETYRELLGPLNAVDNNAVNVHSSPTEGAVRVYGEKINSTFANMTPDK